MLATQFIVAAAALVLMCVIALVWPVWRAARRQPAPTRTRGLIAALTACLIVVPALIHLALGGAGTLQNLADQRATPDIREARPPSAEQIVAMVNRLSERMKSEPDNAEGWMMLGRASYVLARYDVAADAYAHANRLLPDNAPLLADEADALAMAQGQHLAGKPSALLQKALTLDPVNLKALALSGAAASERGEQAQALRFWERALKTVPEGSETAQALQATIAQTRQSMGGEGTSGTAGAAGSVPRTAKSSGSAPPAVAAGSPQAQTKAVKPNGDARGAGNVGGQTKVSGTVRLDPGFKAQTRAEDTVFIFARAADGSRVPLALLRRTVADLPVQFTLDESMARVPSARLMRGQSVRVGARVSRSGLAAPQSGDIEGLSDPVAVGANGVQIVLDHRLP